MNAWNTKFEFFCYYLFLFCANRFSFRNTDIHTQRPTTKNIIFEFRGPQNDTIPSKFQIRKFDPKTILPQILFHFEHTSVTVPMLAISNFYFMVTLFNYLVCTFHADFMNIFTLMATRVNK